MESSEYKEKELKKYVIPDVNKLKIRKFNPKRQLKHDRIIFLIGRRGSGKSVLEKDLLYHMRDRLDMGLAITRTRGSQDMFESCMPVETVKNEYFESQLSAIIEFQLKESKLRKKEDMRKIFILMDDMMFDKSIFKGTTIRDLFMNGRHYNLFFINSLQYCMDVEPQLRSQIDYVFAMWEPIVKNRTKLWENFFGIFEDLNQFNTVFKMLTDNYSAMVIDNTNNSTNIEDAIFWYKADPEESSNFKLGSDIYWALSRKFYISPEELAAQEAERKAFREKNPDAPSASTSSNGHTSASGGANLMHTYSSPASGGGGGGKDGSKKKRLTQNDILMADEDGDMIDEQKIREEKEKKKFVEKMALQQQQQQQQQQERQKQQQQQQRPPLHPSYSSSSFSSSNHQQQQQPLMKDYGNTRPPLQYPPSKKTKF